MPSHDDDRIYWTRDSTADVSTWTMQYNAWPGREWYLFRSGDTVHFPGRRISAETSIHRMDDGTYMARTVRVNTTGPNYRRTERGLDRQGAQWQCDHWQLLHEQYALGRLAVRSVVEEVTPRCDGCNGTEEDSPMMEWNGDEGMHQECIAEMNNTIARALGEWQAVPMPEQPDRPRLNARVPDAHDGWFV